MAPANEPHPQQPHSPADVNPRQYDRLKARAERWARLCSELSTHAAELRELRNGLIPDEREARRHESWLEARHNELEQREVKLERRRRALERRVSEFVQRRKQLLAWQNGFEAGQRQKWDQHLLKAAQLEQQAEQRLVETAAWADELGGCEAELHDMLRELDSECRQLDAELNELPEARCASQAQ